MKILLPLVSGKFALLGVEDNNFEGGNAEEETVVEQNVKENEKTDFVFRGEGDIVLVTPIYSPPTESPHEVSR